MPDNQSKDDIPEAIQSLVGDLEMYARKIAGLSCPTNCCHYTTTPDETGRIGCSLEVATPLDCMEANVTDVAKWMIAQGWRKTKTTTIVHTERGEVGTARPVSDTPRQPKIQHQTSYSVTLVIED